MNPELKTKKDVPPAQPSKPRSEQETDAYAQSLIQMVNLDYQEKQAAKPSQKRYFSKKRIIYLAVSTLVGLILTIVVNHALKSNGTSGTQGSQSKQLLNSVRTFDNSSSY